MKHQSSFPQALSEGSFSSGNGQQIAERIASSISLGMLSVGEKLPSEQELAHQFGVAVATLRKALAALREDGIVITRRGRNGGTFVVRAPFPAREHIFDYYNNRSVVELRDLGDEHIAISTAIVRLACIRVHSEALGRLGELAARLGEAATSAERASADSHFHIEVAVLAQSPRLLRSEVRLQSEIGPLIWSDIGGEMSVSSALADHRALIEAFAAEDSDRAQRITEEHIRKNIYRLIDTKLTLGLQSNEDEEKP